MMFVVRPELAFVVVGLFAGFAAAVVPLAKRESLPSNVEVFMDPVVSNGVLG